MERPFNFKRAKLARVKGRVNKIFPPIANKTAKTANIRNNKILKPLDIFFDVSSCNYPPTQHCDKILSLVFF